MARVNVSYLREMWVLVNVSAIPALAMGSMRRHEQRAMLLDKVVKSTLESVALHALFLLSLTTFLHLDDMRIRDYLLFYAMMLVGMLLFRVAAAYALKEYRRRGYNYTRVVIVGAGANGERLASSLQKDGGFGYKILGFFDDSAMVLLNQPLSIRFQRFGNLWKTTMCGRFSIHFPGRMMSWQMLSGSPMTIVWNSTMCRRFLAHSPAISN